MKFDARTFAQGLLSAGIAQGSQPDMPAFYRTILLEVFEQEVGPRGVRVVCMDHQLMILAWVPFHGTHPLAMTERPDDGELPDRTIVCIDRELFLAEFCRKILKLTKGQDDNVNVALVMEVVEGVAEAGNAQVLDGIGAAPVVHFKVPDVQDVICVVYDGAYPNWRFFDSTALEPAARTKFGPELGRVTGLFSLWPGLDVEFHYCGNEGPIAIRLDSPTVDIRGVGMPRRLTDQMRGIFTVPRSVPQEMTFDFDGDDADELVEVGEILVNGRPLIRTDEQLLAEARRLIVSERDASYQFLQRRLGIGYTRADRILAELEREGVVGPALGARPRNIYAVQTEFPLASTAHDF